VILVLILLAALWGGKLALATPDVGAPPAGPAHGSTEREIAASLAVTVRRELATSPHAILVLSEQDLTVLAVAHNPNPSRFRSPQVRVRNATLVITTLAELSSLKKDVTGVLYVKVGLAGTGSSTPTVTTRIIGVDIGELPVPDFVSSWVGVPAASPVDPASALLANPALKELTPYLDCAAVAADGVRLSFHRPDAVLDPAHCATPGAQRR